MKVRYTVGLDWANCRPVLHVNGAPAVRAGGPFGGTSARISNLCVNGENRVSLSLQEAGEEGLRCEAKVLASGPGEPVEVLRLVLTDAAPAAHGSFTAAGLPIWEFLRAERQTSERGLDKCYAEVLGGVEAAVRDRDVDRLYALLEPRLRETLLETGSLEEQVPAWRDWVGQLLNDPARVVDMTPAAAPRRELAFDGRVIFFSGPRRSPLISVDGATGALELNLGIARVDGRCLVVR